MHSCGCNAVLPHTANHRPSLLQAQLDALDSHTRFVNNSWHDWGDDGERHT